MYGQSLPLLPQQKYSTFLGLGQKLSKLTTWVG